MGTTYNKTMTKVSTSRHVQMNLLGNVPTFFKSMGNIKNSHIRGSTPSILIHSLQVIKPKGRKGLIPTFCSKKGFVRGAIKTFKVISIPRVFPSTFPTRRAIVQNLIYRCCILFPKGKFPIVLRKSERINHTRNTPTTRTYTSKFRYQKRGRKYLSYSHICTRRWLHSKTPHRHRKNTIRKVNHIGKQKTTILSEPIQCTKGTRRNYRGRSKKARRGMFHSWRASRELTEFPSYLRNFLATSRHGGHYLPRNHSYEDVVFGVQTHTFFRTLCRKQRFYHLPHPTFHSDRKTTTFVFPVLSPERN